MTPLPTPNQFGPSPLLPLGSAHPNPILISTYKNRKGIHNTYESFAPCHFSHLGWGCFQVCPCSQCQPLSRSQTPFVEKIAFATGILVLKLKGAGKAVSPSKWAESVRARCCSQKLGSWPPEPQHRPPVWNMLEIGDLLVLWPATTPLQSKHIKKPITQCACFPGLGWGGVMIFLKIKCHHCQVETQYTHTPSL